MDTPICDFVENYVKSNAARVHMPGHKGRSLPECGFGSAFGYDITEIQGADALFEAEGIIRQGEENAKRLFGTAETVYSAGGSTLCIQAMLSAACGRGKAFICARNAHRSVINTCALLDLEPVWLYPEYRKGSAVSGEISPENVENAIISNAEKHPACVFITSPDYLGKISDIRGIAEICRKYDIPLLVDNAHGAYLAFLEKNLHPIALGADMCCDSAHKTLPVLTGGAYLHAGKRFSAAELKRNMSLFGSTSPSYLILESLDLCNKYLAGSFRKDLAETAERVNALKARLSAAYEILDSEPLKLTVNALPCGLSGNELAARLRERGVETEYSDSVHVVMMFSTMNTESDFERVAAAMETIPMPRIRIEPPDFQILPLKRGLSPAEACFSPKERVNIEDSLGKIAAETVSVCPPCVPAVTAGEIIDENTIKILKTYSIFQINVVK